MCTGCNQQNWQLTVWELEADLGIPKTAVSEILMQDLGMKWVMAKFVPQILLPEQKEYRVAVANDLIQTTTNEPDFLKKVITRNESWVYSYDPEMKAQSSQWKLPGSPHLKKVWQSHSKIKTVKVLSIMSMPARPPGPNNKEYHLNVLRPSVFFVGQEMQYKENRCS